MLAAVKKMAEESFVHLLECDTSHEGWSWLSSLLVPFVPTREQDAGVQMNVMIWLSSLLVPFVPAREQDAGVQMNMMIL